MARRSAAQSGRRGCRSTPVTGSGWRWARQRWWHWGSGSEWDRRGPGDARWGCGGTGRQLAWQTGRLPASGVSVGRGRSVCVLVCEQVESIEPNQGTERKRKPDRHGGRQIKRRTRRGGGMSDGRGQAGGRMLGRRRKRRQSERQTGGGGVGSGG